jgi:hypothetical protein
VAILSLRKTKEREKEREMYIFVDFSASSKNGKNRPNTGKGFVSSGSSLIEATTKLFL